MVDRYATPTSSSAAPRSARRPRARLGRRGQPRPGAFADPDRFDVRRENARQHLAFARGPHVCIGMHLARLEAHTAVGRLLERLPALRLDPARPSAPPAWSSASRPRCTSSGPRWRLKSGSISATQSIFEVDERP
jgi:hypothetical protein